MTKTTAPAEISTLVRNIRANAKLLPQVGGVYLHIRTDWAPIVVTDVFATGSSWFVRVVEDLDDERVDLVVITAGRTQITRTKATFGNLTPLSVLVATAVAYLQAGASK